MTPRRARPSDAAMIAKVHVKSWQEAYAGLLPKSEIAARSVAERTE